MTAGPELFDRRCSVTVDTLELHGFDVSFTITKTLKPEPNTCELEVYNLSEDHITQLQQLQDESKQATRGIACRIEAGYADDVSLVWLGDLRTASTVYDSPGWVTRLSSGDGEKGWKNAREHVSYGPRTPLETALRAMVRAMGWGEGNLSRYVAKLKHAGIADFPHGVVISGSQSRELRDFARSAGLEFSVQDGALQLLENGRALDEEAIVLSSSTGLVGSPSVDSDGVLTCDTLMIPGVRPGRLVVMEAGRDRGNYRIVRAVCKGDTAGDDWGYSIEAKRY